LFALPAAGAENEQVGLAKRNPTDIDIISPAPAQTMNEPFVVRSAENFHLNADFIHLPTIPLAR